MTKFMLLIDADGDTTGSYEADAEPSIGDTVSIQAKNENGMPIEVTGTVLEIL